MCELVRVRKIVYICTGCYITMGSKPYVPVYIHNISHYILAA